MKAKLMLGLVLKKLSAADFGSDPTVVAMMDTIIANLKNLASKVTKGTQEDYIVD